jgi:hypothetical protein
VSRVHGLVDCYSDRSTVDHDHGRAACSLELTLPGGSGYGGSMCWLQNGEGGGGEPHHGQEVAAEDQDFASNERGTVAVVEA